jgi:hypothetical protein
MSEADEDIDNQVSDLPSKRRNTRKLKESEIGVGSTGGGLAPMAVKSNFDPIIKINGNFTDKDKIIEFLKSRGFAMEQKDDNFEIRVTHRSIGAGLNEIFVESDELEAIKQFGNLMKIIYSEEVLILKCSRVNH